MIKQITDRNFCLTIWIWASQVNRALNENPTGKLHEKSTKNNSVNETTDIIYNIEQTIYLKSKAQYKI